MSSANIGSQEVLKRFRHKLVEFDDECQRALASVSSDLSRVIEWLRREQLPYWSRELRKREELVRLAKGAYITAQHGSRHTKKASAVEELKALQKAKRMLAQAEEKIALVKRWSQQLEQKGPVLMGPCRTLANLLATTTPRALGRLDQMLDSLDDYLRPVPPA